MGVIEVESSGTATRTTAGGRETAAYIGDPGSEMFVVLHLPDAPVASVLVCPSILTDLVSNYQRETRLSRALAADGIAVARFHYRGTGHSEGDPLAATFETMVRDAADALAHLAAHATTDSVGFVGSRWGALVAAEAARAHPEAPIALWEPALKGAQYFDEAITAQSVALVSGKLVAPKPKELMAAEGWADIIGFPASRALLDSADDLELVGMLDGTTRPLLYLAPAKGDGLSRKDQGAVDALAEAGLQVEGRASHGPKAWWFIDDFETIPTQAADVTAEWFSSQWSSAT